MLVLTVSVIVMPNGSPQYVWEKVVTYQHKNFL